MVFHILTCNHKLYVKLKEPLLKIGLFNKNKTRQNLKDYNLFKSTGKTQSI